MEKTQQSNILKTQKINILKTISGQTVQAAGACRDEFERFVKRFGFFTELNTSDVAWIIENENIWDEWLQDNDFFKVEVEEPETAFEGEWYDPARAEKGKIYLRAHTEGKELWVDLVDHNGEHLTPCNILSIRYDKERKAIRIGRQPGFRAPNQDIENDGRTDSDRRHPSGHANILIENN